jgi:hypothetical protein
MPAFVHAHMIWQHQQVVTELVEHANAADTSKLKDKVRHYYMLIKTMHCILRA